MSIHYFAPMEGVTGYIYRRIHHKYYPGVDKYFAPFMSPTPDCIMNPKEKTDVLPEHNEGLVLIPQIMANRSEVFIPTAKRLKEMGYEEVNFNLGCPSGTVTAKGKGAGFLSRPEELDQCLSEIFEAVDMEISIKTRVGFSVPEEMDNLMEIYNKYPIKELIVHPRVRADFYKGQPRLETFLLVMEQAKMPVCYNGDICERADERRIYQMFPGVSATMIGRGFLRNPDLLAELQGADLQSAGWGVQQEHISCRDDYDWEKLKCFHDDIYFGYREATYGDAPALFRMKELWNHMQGLFEDIPDMPKILKKIRKATRHEDYMSLVDALWQKKRESEGF